MIFKNTITQHGVFVRSGLGFIMVCLFVFTNAQTVTKAEYFFDTDPGQGNGTAITIVAGDPLTFTPTISTAGLNPGYHLLYLRTRSSTGKWSLFEPKEFLIDDGRSEYFFDTDPGPGNGTPLPAVPFNGTITPTIPTDGLKDGVHFLFIRTRHNDKSWSLSDPQLFYIRTRIVLAEYFIDKDLGFGNGTPLPIPDPDDLITYKPIITTPALPDGVHYLFIRTKDIHGKWSHFEPVVFTVDAALPIELFDFVATATLDGRVKLQWTTATEINNDFFTVEHSAPRLEFNELFDVPGAGMSTREIEYEKIHENPNPGINYYRLKQTDFDGTFSYSKVVSAEVIKPTSFYPNPISDKWVVEFADNNGNKLKFLEILDLTGRKIAQFKTDRTKAEFAREGIATGTYILKIIFPDTRTEFMKINFR